MHGWSPKTCKFPRGPEGIELMGWMFGKAQAASFLTRCLYIETVPITQNICRTTPSLCTRSCFMTLQMLHYDCTLDVHIYMYSPLMSMGQTFVACWLLIVVTQPLECQPTTGSPILIATRGCVLQCKLYHHGKTINNMFSTTFKSTISW